MQQPSKEVKCWSIMMRSDIMHEFFLNKVILYTKTKRVEYLKQEYYRFVTNFSGSSDTMRMSAILAGYIAEKNWPGVLGDVHRTFVETVDWFAGDDHVLLQNINKCHATFKEELNVETLTVHDVLKYMRSNHMAQLKENVLPLLDVASGNRYNFILIEDENDGSLRVHKLKTKAGDTVKFCQEIDEACKTAGKAYVRVIC